MPSAAEFLSDGGDAQSASAFLDSKEDRPHTPVDQGIGRTALDQAMQGATFGFGDEVSDRLGAVGAKLYDKTLGDNVTNGQSIGDLVNEARANTKQRLSDEFNTRPALSIGSNLAGALLTGGAGEETAAGSAIGDALKSGSLGARIGKGALAGAASGAVYGTGAANDGNRLEGAEQGALTGAVAGGAVPAVGGALSDVGNTVINAGRGLLARSPQAVQDAAQNLKNNASDIYKQMRAAGAVFHKDAGNELSQGIDAALNNPEHDFIPELNPKTQAIVDRINKRIEKDGSISLSHLDQYRRMLGKIGGSEDGVSAGAVRNAIDGFVDNAEGSYLQNGSAEGLNLLQQGRKQYQQASKFEDISDILTRADGDPNKIKAGLTRFLDNTNNTRGWSPEELAALKDAASGSGTEKLLKMGGKFGFDLGTSKGLGNTVAPLVGGAITGSPIAPVAGTVARYGQKLAGRGKAESLLRTLEGKGGDIKINPEGLGALPSSAPAAQIENQPQQQLPAPRTVTQYQPMSYSSEVPIAPKETPDISGFSKAESGDNPNAQSKTSSASGLFQFTNKTWADMVNKYGAQTGIGLRDKANPDAQRTMAGLLAKDNVQYLQKTIGRVPTKGELYAAHVLGGPGAAKLINADPNREAIMLFPRQVLDANRTLFFNGKQPRTVAQLQQLLTQKVS